MRFRHLAHQSTRLANARSPLLLSQPALYRFHSNHFCSNNDEASRSSQTDAIKKKLKAVSTETLKNTISESSDFWSLTAVDEEHRVWIRRFNQSLSQHDTEPTTPWNFAETSDWLKFHFSRAFDGWQRWRMRDLKGSVMSYEEFMIGAVNAFRAIEAMDVKTDAERIRDCFGKRLHSEVKQIQRALFGGRRYSVRRVRPFGHKLNIAGLYGGANGEELEYLEMHFTTRMFYELQRTADGDGDGRTKQRCADIEWVGLFRPRFGGEEAKYERFDLCERGFVINGIEVDEC